MSFDINGYQPVYSGDKASYNLSASTVVKATAGRLVRVSVNTAGAAAGTVNDCATVAAAAAANQIGVIPNAVGIYYFDWPCSTGIVYVLGTGQNVSISYI